MFEGSRLLIFLFAVMTVTLTLSSTATSRDVAKIVFVSDRDGNYELYIMNRDGSGQTRLTNSPEAEGFPAGSPDGRTIAFLRQASNGSLICLMDRDGGNIRIIPGVLSSSGGISWSPDGTRIAYSSGQRIKTVRIDGSDNTVLSPSQVVDSNPSWSPDGSSIAFVRNSMFAGPSGIMKMRTDGGGTVPVALHNFYYAAFGDPSWSPDGSRILFTYPGQGDLADNDSIAYAQNGGIVDVIVEQNGLVLRSGPKYSPDGQDLVYYQTFNNFGTYKITLLNRVLPAMPSSNFSPDWLPARLSTSISGRVTTPGGMGLRNVSVVLSDDNGTHRIAQTSSFGMYQLDDVEPGRQYSISVASKRFRFQARTLTPSTNITGFDFIGLE